MDYTKNEVVAKGQMAALLGARVVITGLWAWASFSVVPGSEVRAQLKAEGYIWCKHKQAWAFRGRPCSAKREMGWDYITQKYGEEEVTTTF